MGCFIFGGGGKKGDSSLDFSKVTMEPQYALAGKKFFNRNKELKAGNISNYVAPAAGASDSPDKLTLLPEVNAARHIPAGVYMSRDVEIGPLAGNIPFISNGGIPYEGQEGPVPIRPAGGPSTDPGKVHITSSGITRHYPAGIYLDHDLEIEGLPLYYLKVDFFATKVVSSSGLTLSNFDVDPIFVAVSYLNSYNGDSPNGYIQSMFVEREGHGVGGGYVAYITAANGWTISTTLAVTWGDDSIFIPRFEDGKGGIVPFIPSTYGQYTVAVVGVYRG